MTLLLDRPARQALLDLKRVLIVDDEEPIRRLLGYMLQSHGYETILAADAREARQRLDDMPFALVLCDVNMPGESGMDLIRHMLQSHGYETILAADAREARQRLDDMPFALVLCDVNMPGESGMDLIRHMF